jgi:hypothetical protein
MLSQRLSEELHRKMLSGGLGRMPSDQRSFLTVLFSATCVCQSSRRKNRQIGPLDSITAVVDRRQINDLEKRGSEQQCTANDQRAIP